MEQKSDRIRLELTDAQKKQLRDSCGIDIQTLEVSVKELEQRIAPALFIK